MSVLLSTSPLFRAWSALLCERRTQRPSTQLLVGPALSRQRTMQIKGLCINAICPGYTKTPFTTTSPEILKAMVERVRTALPMERMGWPEEIADGVLYLFVGRSSFVTGSALSVDGRFIVR